MAPKRIDVIISTININKVYFFANNMEFYRVLALQMTCHAVNLAANRTEARDLMQKSIDRLAQQIPVSLAFINSCF